MRKILSLSNASDSFRVSMDTIIEDAFHAHASKGITRYGHTKDRMYTVNGYARNKVSRSDQESVFEKEVT